MNKIESGLNPATYIPKSPQEASAELTLLPP